MTLEEQTKHLLATHKGIGMIPPFYAETASVKEDQSWPYWIIRNKSCNSFGCFFSRVDAEALAPMLNKLTKAQ
jgi:hypothetical protein